MSIYVFRLLISFIVSNDSLGGDFLAGATVAAMLIPQSVSYASSLAKLSPVTGLVRFRSSSTTQNNKHIYHSLSQFSAAIPGIVYALLGTSRQLNVAPEAALSLLLGQAIAEVHQEHPDPHSGEGDAVALAVASLITLQVCVGHA
jgi:MFS superfamily sulfate permease-like transporter